MKAIKQLCLTFCFLTSMNGFAQTYVIIGDLLYQLNGTEAYVAGYVGSPIDIVIPATIESDGLSFKVTRINKEAFNNCQTLQSVSSLGNNPLDIYMYAFKNCSSLQTISFPNVEYINYGAFWGCTDLSKVFLGNRLECVGAFVFRNCSKLTYVVIPKSLIHQYDPNNGAITDDSRIYTSYHRTFEGCAIFYGCDRLQAIIYLGDQTSKCESNATVYNVKSILQWSTHSYTYSGRVATPTFTSNLPAGFQPKDGFELPSLEKNVGYYETTIPVTFANNDMEFMADIPYTYTITPVTLTARVKDATRVYGDANPQFQTEYTGFITGEDESVITNKGTYSTSATASSTVGTYNVTLSGAAAQNYTFQYESGTLTVTKAPLTMTPRNKAMTYGDRVPTMEVDYAGLKNNELKPAWITEPTITTTATSESNAGTYPITIAGGEAKNYEVTYNQGTLTINKASLTATTKNATREYGDENPDFEMSYSGLKNGEAAPSWAVAPTFASPATKTSPVGTYAITATGGEAWNYVVQFVNTGKLTVTKAPLTAKARNYTRKQGEDNPTFVVDYTGFKNGETKLALTQEPIATTTATRNSRPGTYEITVSGGVAMNYDISYVSGTLTITPREDPGDETDNVLTIGNVKGNKGTQVTLPIALKNKHQITGFQFDLYLPDGVTIATNDRGKMIINTTSRMDGSYTVTGNQWNGFVRIVGYSGDSEAFTGSEGDILNITLDISNSIADGDYTIRLKDIVLSDVNNTEYHPVDVGAMISVSSYTLGDVDNSGAVNINDVVCIINYILNRTNGTFIEDAADVDFSGTININDVVTLINRFILHRNSAPRRAPAVMTEDAEITDHLFIDNLSIKPGETIEIAMQLANDNEVRAVQGNIKLPEGLKFATKRNGNLDVKNLDERSEDFTLSCALQEDGSMTFAHYSGDGFAYEGHEGGIFTFKVTAEETAEPGDYEIDLTGVVLSINGVGYEMPDLVSQVAVMNADGISLTPNPSPVGEGSIYNLAGQRLYKPQRGVNVVDGKKVVVR